MSDVCSLMFEVLSPVKEVFIEDRVVVGEGLRQSGQSRGRDLLQGRLYNTKILHILEIFRQMLKMWKMPKTLEFPVF